MDVHYAKAVVVKCSFWIIFQFTQNTIAFSAFLTIAKGQNISLFDLENLHGIKCGSISSGTYRDPNIDTIQDKGCPEKVYLCFPDCAISEYTVELNVTEKPGKLVTWMKSNPLNPIDTSFSIYEKGFDFIVKQNSSLHTKAAVLNLGSSLERPRIFAINEGEGEPLSNIQFEPDGKFNPDIMFEPQENSNFEEFFTMMVKFDFMSNCRKPRRFETRDTCQEELVVKTQETTPTTEQAPTHPNFSLEFDTTQESTTTTEQASTHHDEGFKFNTEQEPTTTTEQSVTHDGVGIPVFYRN